MLRRSGRKGAATNAVQIARLLLLIAPDNRICKASLLHRSRGAFSRFPLFDGFQRLRHADAPQLEYITTFTMAANTAVSSMENITLCRDPHVEGDGVDADLAHHIGVDRAQRQTTSIPKNVRVLFSRNT